ncbi:MAG: hypothetical protein HY701_02295 [Gemmatimonadetes bacterium]|nr:hypothetical protein [Gemmatimonadota bacterium]
MTSMRYAASALAFGALLVCGCAGDGTGLDEYGSPLAASRPPLAPTLSSLQANIFTPMCTACHTGEAAPLGLALDAGQAWRNLVSRSSSQMPALPRVNPGKPDSSYLVWKIEGHPAIQGGRMPLGLAPLSAEQIAAVRGWIQDGAAQN